MPGALSNLKKLEQPANTQLFDCSKGIAGKSNAPPCRLLLICPLTSRPIWGSITSGAERFSTGRPAEAPEITARKFKSGRLP